MAPPAPPLPPLLLWRGVAAGEAPSAERPRLRDEGVFEGVDDIDSVKNTNKNTGTLEATETMVVERV